MTSTSNIDNATQVTLEYIGKNGDTIARDYFKTFSEAESFANDLLDTYKNDGIENTYALSITDENDNELFYIDVQDFLTNTGDYKYLYDLLNESTELSTEHAFDSIVDAIKRFYEVGGFEKLPVGRKDAFMVDISGPDKERLAAYFEKQPEFNYEMNDDHGIVSHEFISDKYDVEIYDSFVSMYKIPQNESLSRDIKEQNITESVIKHIYYHEDPSGLKKGQWLDVKEENGRTFAKWSFNDKWYDVTDEIEELPYHRFHNAEKAKTFTFGGWRYWLDDEVEKFWDIEGNRIIGDFEIPGMPHVRRNKAEESQIKVKDNALNTEVIKNNTNISESRPDKEAYDELTNKEITIVYGNSRKEVESCEPIVITSDKLKGYEDSYAQVIIVESLDDSDDLDESAEVSLEEKLVDDLLPEELDSDSDDSDECCEDFSSDSEDFSSDSALEECYESLNFEAFAEDLNKYFDEAYEDTILFDPAKATVDKNGKILLEGVITGENGEQSIKFRFEPETPLTEELTKDTFVEKVNDTTYTVSNNLSEELFRFRFN